MGSCAAAEGPVWDPEALVARVRAARGCSAGRCWRRSPCRRAGGRWRSPAGGWSGRGRCAGCGRRGWSRGAGRLAAADCRAVAAPGRCTATITPGCVARSRAMSATARPRRRATRRRARCAAAPRRARRRRRAARRAAHVALRGRRAGSALAPDAGDRDRRQRRARRAAPPGAPRRRRDPPPRALQLSFRAKWPPWVRAPTSDGNPVFDQLGMLRLDARRRYVPPVGSEAYRIVVRDAYLLAGRLLPVDVDGRKLMALRHQRQIPPAARRPVRSDDQRELAELAHRTGEPISLLPASRPPTARRGWRGCAAPRRTGRGAR